MPEPVRPVMDHTTQFLQPPAVPGTAGAGPEAWLVHIYPAGPFLGRRIPLGRTTFLVGRSDECQLRIEDQSVSRRHALVEPAHEGYTIRDLGSTNGTFVNEQAVSDGTLRDGDHLRVGNHVYRFLSGNNVEAQYHEEIHRLTLTDGLTEIPNRRHLLEFLERELARSARHGRPLSLVLFDVDRFKAINDQRGHLCGDQVLRDLAGRVRPAVRQDELFARYGGEEFAVVLPEVSRDGAVHVAERLRQLVRERPFEFAGQSFSVTISLGIATTFGEDGLGPDGLIRAADQKLYQAKTEGRDRLVA